MEVIRARRFLAIFLSGMLVGALCSPIAPMHCTGTIVGRSVVGACR